MDKTALFKITYGLFVAAVAEGGRMNGCIINTAAQATDTPPRLIVTMQKANLTAEMIGKKGSFTVSVLSLDCPMAVVEQFGYQSGRDADKLHGGEYVLDGYGNPYLSANTVARYSCKVEGTIDLETHLLFVCSVAEAEVTGEGAPLSYADYRRIKAGGSIAAAPAGQKVEKYVCSVCHYVYDGDIPFEDLPDTWVCPICKQPKRVFTKIAE